MSRLAVDQAFGEQGIGGALLADAPDRVIRSEIAAHALMVAAADESAAAFYEHYRFIALTDLLMTLFLPLATVTRNPMFAPPPGFPSVQSRLI